LTKRKVETGTCKKKGRAVKAKGNVQAVKQTP